MLAEMPVLVNLRGAQKENEGTLRIEDPRGDTPFCSPEKPAGPVGTHSCGGNIHARLIKTGEGVTSEGEWTVALTCGLCGFRRNIGDSKQVATLRGLISRLSEL